MQISLKKFVQLTALIAASASVVPACTSNSDSDDNNTTAGAAGESSAGKGSGGEESSTAGKPSGGENTAGNAGSPSEEGVGGSAGSPSEEGVGGSAGSPSEEGVGGSAGSPSEEGVGGSAGSPSEEGLGGSAGSPSEEGVGGSAGSPSEEGLGGSAGSPSEEGLGGSAGSPSEEGLGGSAGSPSEEGCLAGDPAAEGLVIDCSVLPYYDTVCPDPSYEGGRLAYGASICNRYSYERAESAQALLDCLLAIPEPTDEGGWCDPARAAEVDACVDAVEARTCVNSDAQAACEAINASCSEITVAECVADAGPLADSEVTALLDCPSYMSSGDTCALDYRVTCLNMPPRLISVTEACSAAADSCSTLTPDVCAAALDVAGTGAVDEVLASSVGRYCVTELMSMDDSMTCDEAFTSCLASYY